MLIMIERVGRRYTDGGRNFRTGNIIVRRRRERRSLRTIRRRTQRGKKTPQAPKCDVQLVCDSAYSPLVLMKRVAGVEFIISNGIGR